MNRSGKNRRQGSYAFVLIAVIASSHVFSCGFVNQRLGQFVLSTWIQPTQPPSHACCPPARDAGRESETPDSGARPTACCIQDATQNLPQMGSQQVPVPDMTGLFVALLPLIEPDRPGYPVQSKLRSGSGPPLYLTHLSLLI